LYLEADPDGNCYIGKTECSLRQRLAKHKNHHKRYLDGKFHFISCFKLFDQGDVNIMYLERDIEDDEVNDRETYWIKNSKKCVNMRASWATKKERVDTFNGTDKRKEYMKQYAERNKEAVRLAKQKYKAKKRQERIDAQQ
jgi:hypothetical protein